MANAKERIERDIQIVTQACKLEENCPFQGFEKLDKTLLFCFVKGSTFKQYTITFTEDYPEDTLVKCSDNTAESQVFNEEVPFVFNTIAQNVHKDMTIPLTKAELHLESHLHQGLGRSVSSESKSSQCSAEPASDMNSDCDCEDDYDYYDDNLQGYSDGEEVHMHPLLAHDMEQVRKLYGDRAITHRLFGAIDDIDVELHIGMSFLDEEIAKAWRVIREEPIMVRLHLSVSRYLDAVEPKVEVFQPSNKDRFGLGSQLRKILENFVCEQWKQISNDYVTSIQKTFHRQPSTSPPKKKLHSNYTTEEQHHPSTPTSGVPDEDSLSSIVEMGFSPELAQNALLISRGNVEDALNLIIGTPEGEMMPRERERLPLSPPRPIPPPRPSRQHAYGKGHKEYKNMGARPKATQKSKTSNMESSPVEDLNLMPSTTLHGKSAKQLPSLENGFLVQVLHYARQRIPTLNEFCVVCDEPHVFQNGAMLKPAVCARELCVFAFQTLGVMSEAAEDIATGAEVVDLLLAMASAACKSHRRDIIFEPFPTVVDPQNPCELALHPKKKDYKRVDKALSSFMSMQDMTRLVGSELKKEMDGLEILAYPLLQWIVTSNRSHIVKLPPEKQIVLMHTPHQFLLLSSPPAKEAIFRAAKKEWGSTFAFHGSHIENWHSIMRVGLINASGTKHQMHGAAYGNGVYLSPQASVSFGYSGMGYGYHKPPKGKINTVSSLPHPQPGGVSMGYRGFGRGRAFSRIPKGEANTVEKRKHGRFLLSKNLTCIALCEVINHMDLRKNANIWVMPNPDLVCTRFFFVYEDGQVGDSNIDTQSEKFHKEIMKAMKYQTPT